MFRMLFRFFLVVLEHFTDNEASISGMAEAEMGGFFFLCLLSVAMFFGSYFAGQIPLLFTMSEVRF